MVANPFNGLEYYGGYSTASFKYAPLTNTITRIPLLRSHDDPTVGNRLDTADNARYYVFTKQSADRNIWFGAMFIRSAYESQVAWYNPADDSIGDVGWAELNHHNMEGIAMNRARTRVIYSGTLAGDGLLAVINTRKKAITHYLRPIASSATQGYLVSVESNKATTNQFVGITEGTSTYKIYCVNIMTGALIWGVTTKTGTTLFKNSSSMFYPIFAHGYVWFYVNNQIAKLNPATGEVTENLQAVTPGQMLFVGDVLYHWDRGTAHVFKVTGLV